MYDSERMARICGDIDRYLRDLSLLSLHERRDLDDRKNFYALAMVLFSLLNAVIDLADELVSARNAGMPYTGRSSPCSSRICDRYRGVRADVPSGLVPEPACT